MPMMLIAKSRTVAVATWYNFLKLYDFLANGMMLNCSLKTDGQNWMEMDFNYTQYLMMINKFLQVYIRRGMKSKSESINVVGEIMKQ